jgi:signal transduction histidine kinase
MASRVPTRAKKLQRCAAIVYGNQQDADRFWGGNFSFSLGRKFYSRMNVRTPRLLITATTVLVTMLTALALFRAEKITRTVLIINASGRSSEGDLQKIRVMMQQLAHTIPAELSALNVSLVRFLDTHDQAEQAEFERRVKQLEFWLEQQRKEASHAKVIIRWPFPFVTQPALFLSGTDELCQVYKRDAQKLFVPRENDDKAIAEDFGRVQQDALQLIEQAGEARAQAARIDAFMDAGRNTLRAFEGLIYVAVFVLVGLCGWLVVPMVFRAFIVPLRRKVIESGQFIQKQEKLAHFGELAAGLAHELRNPLTAINARLFTLQRGIPENTAEFEDAQVIGNEINRLDRILNEFLRLARPREPQMVSMIARPSLEEVQSLLQRELEGRALEIKLGETTTAKFCADPQQLKQVLINLVQNAAESIGQSPGTITLDARTDRRCLKGNESDVVIIEVTDTGPGIAPELHDRLFDPFFSTKQEGTGLGLPISHQIVDKHGGAIEFRSTPGHTTFGIVLPVRPGAEHER